MAVEGVSYKVNTQEVGIRDGDPPQSQGPGQPVTKSDELLEEGETNKDVEDAASEAQGPASQLQYSIDQSPPWYLCIVLGFQHYLTMFGATLAIPLILTPAICIGEDGVGKSEIIGTIFFVSGLVTILQVTVGSRLPIVQGGTFAFLTPVFAILSLDKWKCPDGPPDQGLNNTNITLGYNGSDVTTLGYNGSDVTTMEPFDTLAWRREVWQMRMREIQGAIIVASLFQVLIGISGAIGIVLRFIGPLAICPTIALIGLSLFESASTFCSKQWGVALMTIFLIVLFSQYLRNVNVPYFYKAKEGGCSRSSYPVFKLFPVILAVMLAWIICIILTYSGALDHGGQGARTDTRLSVLYEASWIRFPYPGQWGLPTVSVSGVFGMLAGVLAGMLESIGDYYACARLAGAPPPPIHAINRGIAMEGFGCILAGLWGTGSGTTSYSENIGAIGITQVASRRVIQTGGLIMLILGMLGKFGALFVTIPDPIIGGVFMVMFGMITAVGISNLQFVDLNSTRNLFVFGFSIFFGLSMPNWVAKNPGVITTNNEIADQIITVLLSTSMFVGGFMGFVLDNTIPGTLEERGITVWEKQIGETSKDDVTGKPDPKLATYDFPIGMSFIRKWSWTKYVPICPTFNISNISCRRKRVTHSDRPPTEDRNGTAEASFAPV